MESKRRDKDVLEGPQSKISSAGGPKGRICLTAGPMFSGKTETLIALGSGKITPLFGTRLDEPARYTYAVAHAADTRYTSDLALASRNGRRLASGPEVVVVRAAALGGLVPPSRCRMILVDEGQFYPDLAEVAERWARAGHDVYVAALLGDAARRPYPQVTALLPLCDHVEFRRGVCSRCGGAASFSARRGDESPSGILIGGGEKYEALCGPCYRGKNPR